MSSRLQLAGKGSHRIQMPHQSPPKRRAALRRTPGTSRLRNWPRGARILQNFKRKNRFIAMLDPETKQRPEDQRHRAEPEDLRRSPGIPGATPSEQQHERRCCQNHEASARHIEPMLAKPGGKPFQRLVHHRKRQRVLIIVFRPC